MLNKLKGQEGQTNDGQDYRRKYIYIKKLAWQQLTVGLFVVEEMRS